MVLLQGYIEEPAGQDSFIIQPPSAYKQQAFRRSSIGSTASFRSSQTSSLDTIQEQSRKLHRTNPDIVSPSQLSMDVFGENLDSLDVWAEEDVFHSTKKHRRNSGHHSQSQSSSATPSSSARRSCRAMKLDDHIGFSCV